MGTTDGQRTDRRLTDELALQREGSPTLPRKALLPLKRRFPHPIPTNTKKALDARLTLRRLHLPPCLSGGGSTDAQGTPPGHPSADERGRPYSNALQRQNHFIKRISKELQQTKQKSKAGLIEAKNGAWLERHHSPRPGPLPSTRSPGPHKAPRTQRPTEPGPRSPDLPQPAAPSLEASYRPRCEEASGGWSR